MANKEKKTTNLTRVAVMGLIIVSSFLFIINRVMNKGKGINK